MYVVTLKTEKQEYKKFIHTFIYRFPDMERMTPLSVLSLRPVSFLSGIELQLQRKQSTEVLVGFYGQEQSNNFKNPVSCMKLASKSSPVISSENTKV